jgi:arylsulfatase A-like enzyme
MFEAADVSDEEYIDGKTTQRTIQTLRRLKKDGKPFFFGCGFKKPHMPFYVPKKYWDMYDRSALSLADNRYLPKGAPKSLRGSNEINGYVLDEYDLESDAWHRAMIHGYYACVSYIDAQIGKILQELKDLELDNNTIVVLWGDHGFHLGEHNFWSKHNTMDVSLRVPLLVHVPGKMQGESNAMVSSIDLYPTLCELAGLPLPSHVQGKSFVPILDDLSQSTQEHVYARFRNGDAAITGRYAFTRYSDGESMLFDHKKDPKENRNVATNPEYKNVVAKMQKLLDQSIKKAEQK